MQIALGRAAWKSVAAFSREAYSKITVGLKKDILERPLYFSCSFCKFRKALLKLFLERFY